MYLSYNEETNKILNKYGLSGITYENNEPNFRPVAKAIVNIEGMSSKRMGSSVNPGNYELADIELANILNSDPNHSLWNDVFRNNTVLEKVIENNGEIEARDISVIRDKNKLTWHEESDLKAMVLVDTDINKTFKHSGGVSEDKAKVEGKRYKYKSC